MGACGSTAARYVSPAEKYRPPSKDELAAMHKVYHACGVSHKDGAAVEAAFNKLRKKCGGEKLPHGYLLADLFYEYCNVHRTPFTSRLFETIVDWKDGYGELIPKPRMDERALNAPVTDAMIDYPRFFIMVWNYNTLDRAATANMLFNIYDPDSSGEIPRENVYTIIDELYGNERTIQHRRDRLKKMVKASAAMTLTQADNGLIKKEWASLLFECPGIFVPLDTIRQRFRDRVCGQKFWNRLQMNRNALAADTDFSEWAAAMRSIGLSVVQDPDHDRERMRSNVRAQYRAMNAEDQAFHDARASMPDEKTMRRIRKNERKEMEALGYTEERRKSDAGTADTNRKIMAKRKKDRAEIHRRVSATGVADVDHAAAEVAASGGSKHAKRRWAHDGTIGDKPITEISDNASLIKRKAAKAKRAAEAAAFAEAGAGAGAGEAAGAGAEEVDPDAPTKKITAPTRVYKKKKKDRKTATWD